MNLAVIFCLAFSLDLLIGDPYSWPHPVRIIGNLLNYFEQLVLKTKPEPLIAGAILVCFLGLVFAYLVFILSKIPFFGIFFIFYFIFAGLSIGCLLKEAKKVLDLLEANKINMARKQISTLVSRDTDLLNEQEILQTLGETTAENFNDGFAAPLFWFLFGGLAGMWFYKTISTADSMWGYKTERFVKLGFFAAKLDDILAFVPARISALALLLVSRKFSLQNLKLIAIDACKMSSPNAGWPMSAVALILERQMGGAATYFGEIVLKPVLGQNPAPWQIEDIKKLCCLLKKTALCFGFSSVFILWII